MTKPYHLTPEQGLRITQKRLCIGEDKYTTFEMDAEMLADCFNAALDEVLGEPVATKLLPDPEDEREGLWFDLADIDKMKALPAGTKLYAPRREK